MEAQGGEDDFDGGGDGGGAAAAPPVGAAAAAPAAGGGHANGNAMRGGPGAPTGRVKVKAEPRAVRQDAPRAAAGNGGGAAAAAANPVSLLDQAMAVVARRRGLSVPELKQQIAGGTIRGGKEATVAEIQEDMKACAAAVPAKKKAKKKQKQQSLPDTFRQAAPAAMTQAERAKIMNFEFKNEKFCIKMTQKRGIVYQK